MQIMFEGRLKATHKHNKYKQKAKHQQVCAESDPHPIHKLGQGYVQKGHKHTDNVSVVYH